MPSNGSGNWIFDIVGNFVARGEGIPSYIVANYTYLDEARVLDKGTVGKFCVSIAEPHQAAIMCATIDRSFANSSNPTKTISVHEIAQQNLQSIGDL